MSYLLPDDELSPEMQEQVDSAAKQIMKSLGVDSLRKEIRELDKKLTSEDSGRRATGLLDLERLMKKNVTELTAKEKIVGFFQAAIQNNVPVLKALSEGTDGNGGYLVPSEFLSEVVMDLSEKPFLRNEVRLLQMQRDVMNIPTLATRPKVTWTTENSAKSTTTASFSQATLTCKKMASILYCSDELIEDAGNIDIVQLIVSLFSNAIGEEEDRVITNGNGTTEPSGFALGTHGIGTISASGNLDFDDIISLVYSLPAKYARNAKFYLHRNNLREIRKIKDSNGRYLWTDSLIAGQPPTVMGFPVVECNYLPESEIYFGDLKLAYFAGFRGGMKVKVTQDSETAFTRDQTAIRIVERMAGTVVLPQALKCLNNIP